MKLIATPIPNGSHGIRVWAELPQGDIDTGEDYAFSCNLIHVAPGVCEVQQAQGDLCNEVAVAIGLKAIELGYSRLRFHRTAGGPATRWASLAKTEGGFDHYDVDLARALSIHEGRA